MKKNLLFSILILFACCSIWSIAFGTTKASGNSSVNKKKFSQYSIGNLVVIQRWEKIKKGSEYYEWDSDTEFQIVEIQDRTTGKRTVISCEDEVSNEGMWCQITSGLEDPGWEDKKPLFPIEAISFDSISSKFIAFTIRSSANGGYLASQYIFNIEGGEPIVLPEIYGLWHTTKFTDENGYIIGHKKTNHNFYFTWHDPIIEIQTDNIIKINPHELTINKPDSQMNPPPRNIILKKIDGIGVERNKEKIVDLFTDVWRCFVFSLKQKDELRWLKTQIEKIKKVQSIGEIKPFAEQPYSVSEIADEMIKNIDYQLSEQ